MITHDLGVVAEIADEVLVMYGGRCVERGPADEIFEQPQHPYTWGLLGSMPRMDRETSDRLIPVKGQPPSLINVPSRLRLPPALPVRGLHRAGRHRDRASRSCARSAPATPPPATSGRRAAPDLDRRDCAEAVARRPGEP